MVFRRGLALLALSASIAAAQDQQQPFRAQSRLVQAWVAIDRGPEQEFDADAFRLRIDGKAHPIQSVDSFSTGVAPVALVAVVETAGLSAAALGKIRRIGAMVQGVVTGDRGRAAVIAFNEQVSTLQPFTKEPEEIARAFSSLGTGGAGTKARMLDAVISAARLLEARADGERRVIMLIAESKDRGSDAKLEDAIERIRAGGIQVFALTYSAWVTPFTTKASELPPSGPLDILAGIGELARMGKTNTTAALAAATGARTFSFARLAGLEKAVEALGEELRAQYLVSFVPGESMTPGWHEIAVDVRGTDARRIRTRPGFQIAAP